MPLQIAMVTSELSPLAKTGGLGDAVAGLARFLAGRGVDVRLFLPAYAKCDHGGRAVHPVSFLQNLPIELGGARLRYSIDSTHLPGLEPFVYLVRCPALYDRPGIYDDRGDEHLRFALLNRAAIESCQRMGFAPHVFHLHDWHAALIPGYLRTLYSWDRLFHKTRTLLTIHNLAFQGVCPSSAIGDLGFGASAALLHQEQLRSGIFSFLTTGLLYADWVSAVSESYAHEIQTPAYGFGLDGMLRARRDHLSGITNGADYGEWDPATDPLIPHPFSPSDLDGKELDRHHLLESLGLDAEPGVPVLGVVSRLTAQKGFDLLFGPLDEILRRRNVRLVALGTGEREYERGFADLQRRHPGKAVFYRGFDNTLAHRIYAGSDLFLMPSRYEPCGLSQMYALRYGSIPVVRKTGGLADTVTLYDSAAGTGTGFVFDHFEESAARWALHYALDSYSDRVAWRGLVERAMAVDFSWERQGERYLELYRALS